MPMPRVNSQLPSGSIFTFSAPRCLAHWNMQKASFTLRQ